MAVIRRSATTSSSAQLAVAVELAPRSTPPSAAPTQRLHVDLGSSDSDMRRNLTSGGHSDDGIFDFPDAAETLEDALQAWNKIMRVSSDIGRYFLKSRITSVRKRRKLEANASTTITQDEGDLSQRMYEELNGKRRRTCEAAHDQAPQETCVMETADTQSDTTESVDEDVHEQQDLRDIRAMAWVIVRLRTSQKRFGNDIRGLLSSLPPSSPMMRHHNQTGESWEQEGQASGE